MKLNKRQRFSLVATAAAVLLLLLCGPSIVETDPRRPNNRWFEEDNFNEVAVAIGVAILGVVVTLVLSGSHAAGATSPPARPVGPYEAFRSAGFGLVELARLQLGTEAIKTINEATRSFQRAVEVEPGRPEAYNDLGTAALHLLRVVPGEQRRDVLADARRVLEKANSLKPGIADYNLACVATQEGEREEALRHLVTALATGAASAEHAMRDEDLQSLRSDPRWQTILASARQRVK